MQQLKTNWEAASLLSVQVHDFSDIMYLHGSMYMDIYFSLIFLKNVGAS
jgi:hypothetical protein